MKLTEEQVQELTDIYRRYSSPIHSDAVEQVLLALDIGIEDFERITERE